MLWGETRLRVTIKMTQKGMFQNYITLFIEDNLDVIRQQFLLLHQIFVGLVHLVHQHFKVVGV